MKDIKEEDDDVIGISIARGMLDHSRMALCIFMLAVVTLNPFGVVLNKFDEPSKNYISTAFGGRTLQDVDSKY
jgi:hypothetical protein